ncbi:MAG: radical SAM protein, partial [Candidatus Aenigmatarchaeota archaeon]
MKKNDKIAKNLDQMQRDFLPDKLLRIYISDYCNFHCKFCDWDNPRENGAKHSRFKIEDLALIVDAMVDTGCHNFQLTGGEPFLQEKQYIVDVVSALSSARGVEQFWVVSNGSLLGDENLCTDLFNAGLRRITVSIAGETNEKYRACSRSDFNLDNILKSIETVSQTGISVYVHVPLNMDGIASFEQLQVLLNRVQKMGVKNAFYFGLYSTPRIEQDYGRIHVDPDKVTEGFLNDHDWTLQHTNKGRPYFTNGSMQVFVPTSKVTIVTETCKQNNCGDYCQGIYSANLFNAPVLIRACKRTFPDHRNEFPIEESKLRNRDLAGVVETCRKMWQY